MGGAPQPDWSVLAKAAQDPDEDGFFWKTLSLMARPASAVTGAVTEGVRTGNPKAAFMKGIRGEHTYGGADIIRAAGGDPKTAMGGYGAPALDLLNPLDPLLYTGGLGALTKAGKVARATQTLSKGAEAFSKGERALLSIGGHTILPEAQGALVGALGKAAHASIPGTTSSLAENPITRGISAMFAKPATQIEQEFGQLGKTALEARARRESEKEIIMSKVKQPYDELQSLPKDRKYPSLFDPNEKRTAEEYAADLMDATKRAPGAEGYIGIKSPDTYMAELLQRAPDKHVAKALALMSDIKGRMVGHMDESQVDSFLQDLMKTDPAHLPHVIAKVDPTLPGSEMVGKAPLKELAKDPQTAHILNYDLHATSEQGVTLQHVEGLPKGFDPETATAADWAKLPRVPAAKIPNEAQTITARAEKFLDEVSRQSAASKFIDELVQRKVAVPWVDAEHANNPGWIKITGGKWADSPLAVPSEINTAMKRYADMTRQPTVSILGQTIQEIFSWWKSMALATPGRISRNTVSGVIRNMEEGLGVLPTQAWHTQKMYRQSGKMIYDANRLIKAGRSPLESKLMVDAGGGVQIPAAQIWKSWIEGRWHGGTPDTPGFIGQELKDSPGAGMLATAKKIRESKSNLNPFHLLTSANGKAEELLRLSLGIHAMGETLRAGGDIVTAGQHASERVLRAHFDYSPQAYSKMENDVSRWVVPFYKWYRNNVPYEFMNMMQHPGQYMPLARAYMNAYETQGISQSDTPEWLRQNLAIPLGQNAEGSQKYIDPSGYLPQLDPVNIANAFAGPVSPGQDRTAEIGRYGWQFLNPFWKIPAEQALGREGYMGKELANRPTEMMGLPSNERINNLLGILPPVGTINRLNPGGIFTEIGKRFGTTPESGIRPSDKNAPDMRARAIRAVFGVKEFTPAPDTANRTRKQWKMLAQKYAGKAKKLRREGGSQADAERYEAMAEEARSKAY